MRAKIKYSTFSLYITAIVVIGLLVGCIAARNDDRGLSILLILYLILIVAGGLYGVVGLRADDNDIQLVSLFKRQRIPMRDVQSVELFQPTMGAMRIFASGGFMGYWGMFSEGDIGRYYAFYGKASDCFLVRMKNGDKYLLGCENPREMVNYIKAHLSPSAA